MIKLVDELYVENFLAITPEPIYNTESGNIKFHDKITVLYGPNSTGKTSIIYALLSLLETVYGPYSDSSIPFDLNNLKELSNNSEKRVIIRGNIGALSEYLELEKYYNKNMIKLRISELEIIQEKLNTYIRSIKDLKTKETYPILSLPGSTLTNYLLDYLILKRLIDDFSDFFTDTSLERIKHIYDIASRKIHRLFVNDRILKTLEDLMKESPLKIEDNTILIDTNSLFRNVLVKYLYPLSKRELIERIREMFKILSAFGTYNTIRELNRYIDFITGNTIDDILIIIKDGITEIYLILNGKEIPLEKLSNGFLNIMNISIQLCYVKILRNLIRSLFNISLPKSLIILDTPEYNIHIDWLYYLLDILSTEEDFQFIIETHSGIILSYSLKNNMKSYYVSTSDSKTQIIEVSREKMFEVQLFSREKEAFMEVF